jgi:AmmeMemoRadiSam system protein A
MNEQGHGATTGGSVPVTGLSDTTRRWLVELARTTVRTALDDGQLHLPDPATIPDDAAAPGAAFVTLRRDGRLLGCIGSMEPVRPLVVDVATHAFDAAFRDPRLPAVTLDDWHHMAVEVSVLGPLERVDVHDLAELSAALRPGIDGVLLTSRDGRGTFLPSVWDQVATPDRFLRELWRKAGLRRDHWPNDLVVERYQVDEFGDP